jgi:predicted NAD/FAD-dependent oxidoreductase
MEVWTILSSPKFAKRYKGPQENLPHDLVDEVTDSMIESLEGFLGLQTNSLRNSVVERRLQLWGAAVPLNTYGKDGFLWDANVHVGVCGDWLVDPSIAGAWESGRRLAEYMKEGPPQRSVGLPSSDRPAVFAASQSVSKAGIGSLQ